MIKTKEFIANVMSVGKNQYKISPIKPNKIKIVMIIATVFLVIIWTSVFVWFFWAKLEYLQIDIRFLAR